MNIVAFLSSLSCLLCLSQASDTHRSKRQTLSDDGDVSLACSGEGMVVRLNTLDPFAGLLFSQTGGKSCVTRGQRRTETELRILFEDNDVDRCGLTREDDGSYSLVIVVQTHPVIQRAGDKAYQLFCYFETETKVITNGYDIIPDVGVTRPDGVTLPSTPSSILNNTAPAPGVRLRIVTGTGEDIVGTKLGEKLFLRIEIDQASIYGIFAKNLRAISPADNDEIELLDSRGCPTDPIIFPGLEKIPDSQDLQGSFEAFKFSDTSVVKFQVNVAFCVGGCNPVSCQDGILSYGKRRKREAVVQKRDAVIPITKNSLVYDVDLGQEILISNTPLSREIFVEAGTKVDAIRDAAVDSILAGRDSGSVFILGDDKESELVCTTLPVIITAGAAVIFLQLCILTTCLLCLHSGRRSASSKRRLSRTASVVTSASGGSHLTSPTPTLHTLYHDQLTYRPVVAPSLANSRMTENSANTLKSLRTTLRD